MDSLLRPDASVATAHRFPVSALPRRHRRARIAAAATVALGLGGAWASQAAGKWSRRVRPVEAVAPVAQPEPIFEGGGVKEPVLADALCATKAEVRWHAPSWTPVMCHQVARAVITAAVKYRLSPGLILGVMLNESDLDENVVTKYRKAGVAYAQDSGLMGVRCVYDQRGRCSNGIVRGLSPGQTAQFERNIDLGAQILALARNGDGVEKRVIRKRLPNGESITTTKLVRCRHKTHAWWAHYNHGSFYISRGQARHYPHRVAVLYYAWAQGLGLPADEVFTDLFSRPLTVVDPGRRPRTADRPVEPRFRTLVDKIHLATGTRPEAAQARTTLASLAPQSLRR
jgi:hypothetical protein